MSVIGRVLTPSPAAQKVHCEADDWYFDPRYTQGACPICGWRPDESAVEEQPWVRELRALPWDLIALGVLLLILVFFAILVASAAGVNLSPKT